MWSTVKRRAKERKVPFNIDIEYAWKLFLEQDRKCALSGLPIEFGIANYASSNTTASLDRIDSSKGYTEGNIQWVHKTLNIMKSTLSNGFFINLCHKVAQTHENFNIICEDSLSQNVFVGGGLQSASKNCADS